MLNFRPLRLFPIVMFVPLPSSPASAIVANFNSPFTAKHPAQTLGGRYLNYGISPKDTHTLWDDLDPYQGPENGPTPDWGDDYTGPKVPDGHRGDCPATQYPLTAIVPPESKWSSTSQERPTFWVYNPYTSEDVTAVTFALEAETGESYVEFPLTIPEETGFVSFTLPETADPLVPGLRYYWSFKVNCDHGISPPIFVQALVTFDPALQVLESRYESYVENGVWLDAVNALIRQRSEAENLTEWLQQWQWLLNSGGIQPDSLYEQPFLEEPLLVAE